jgi:hypothetical protein
VSELENLQINVLLKIGERCEDKYSYIFSFRGITFTVIGQ